MTRSRLSRFPRGGGSSRRQSSWEPGPGGETSLIAGTVVELFGTSVQAATGGLTAVRLRGDLFVQLASNPAAIGDGYEGAMGVGIVSENAAGIGVTAVPAPLTDVRWDGWLYHRFFTVKGVSATLEDGPGASVRIDVDSKAMRKFNESDVMVAVLEVVERGTETVQATFQSRILLKLS